MKNFLLLRVRLLHYYLFFLGCYSFILVATPSVKYETGSLALFTANSFLYGFYVAPILAGQKARIEELHRTVRAEANAIFAIALGTKKMPKTLRNTIQDMLVSYLQACIRERQPDEGEARYAALISYCLEYEGKHKADVEKLLDKLVANQNNRTNFAMQMTNRIFTNEWVVMLVLFGITESFILTIRTGQGSLYKLLPALLCTSLSMLLIILLKLSTLTHKKAQQIWDPYIKLVESHFYRIN